MEKQELIKLFPERIRKVMGGQDVPYEEIREIRFRAEKPVAMNVGGQERLLMDGNRLFLADRALLKEMLEYMSGFSVYAFEEEMRQGYLTLKGGHRVGIAGKPVVKDGEVVNFHYISGFHFRISHEVKGAGDEVLPYLYENRKLCNTLILSPPGFGKTTLLRDLIRRISDGNENGAGLNVGVVDERSEIGGAYLGIPQNDLGMRTDLLDDCPKAQGMYMLLRSMGPQVIAVDELGGTEDTEAVLKISRCGVRMVMTAHSADLSELLQKKDMECLFESHIFERLIFIKAPMGERSLFEVYDGSFGKIR
ncbi:stage III sporulation protein AA [bacterium C-53]|nr:stage III sporulation protein AA [Lachnospiraceae bacterium]NBI03285.1 stage III sporulation protein AA [Lachnospiraceae bacterium]RKJ09833.1 stage III sporulation protein AA [bacterium C-53]